MAIIDVSDKNIRSRVLKYLRDMKTRNPNATVLDVGGAANPWCDEFVDAYIDINYLKTEKKVFIGDICQPKLWEEVAKVKYDFSICTQVLEDIRNPEFVIRQIINTSKAGFISVPNKHTEMSCVESSHYLGYYHHRWIFTILSDQTLKLFPKLVMVDYFLPKNRLHHFLGSNPFLRRFVQRRLRNAAIPGGPGLSWIDLKKVSMNYELGFIWERGFSWEIARGDYAGPDYWSMIEAYRTELAEGL